MLAGHRPTNRSVAEAIDDRTLRKADGAVIAGGAGVSPTNANRTVLQTAAQERAAFVRCRAVHDRRS
jgi:hypothetical protein